MSLQLLHRDSVLTLSSSNLLALVEVESQLHDHHTSVTDDGSDSPHHSQQQIEFSESALLRTWILTDFVNNTLIMTLPALFTNFFWRLQNLYGVAVSHHIGTVIGQTTWEIASWIFIFSFIVDASRQLYSYQQMKHYDSYGEIFSAYYKRWGLLSSGHLAFKDFAAVVFWTIGYVLVADDHQVLTDKSKPQQWTFRALGGAFGAFFGLLFVSELIALTEYGTGILISFTTENPYSLDQPDKMKSRRKGFWFDTNQRGIFGVATKGFVQGIAQSVMADIDLYLIFRHLNMDSDIAIILDSLCVSIVSSFAFPIGGIITSLFGYCEQYRIDWNEKDDYLRLHDPQGPDERDRNVRNILLRPDLSGLSTIDSDCSVQAPQPCPDNPYQPLLRKI